MNKELHDKLNSLNPVENNDNLSWDNVGDNILREVSNRKKKKRRKILFWWIGSLGLILFGSISYFSIVDQSKYPATIESQNIPYSKDMRTATHNSPNVSNKSLKSKDSFDDPSRVVDINYPVSTETSRDLSTSQAMVKVTESSVQIIQSKTSREYDYLDTGDTNTTLTSPLNDTSYTEGLWSEDLLQNQNLIVTNTEDDISITNPITTSREEIIIDYLEYKMALQVGLSDLQIRSLPSDIILIDRARPNMQKHRITLFGGATLSDIQDHYTNASSLVGSFSGIDYNYLINRHLNISVGLQQEQYRFRTQFISMNPQLVYSPGTVETVYQLNGQPELTIETDSIPGVRIRRFSHYNTVNLTTIPLSVGTKKRDL